MDRSRQRRVPVRSLATATLAVVALAAVSARASAHVDYVTDPPSATRDAVAFAAEVLGNPVNAALVGGEIGRAHV